MAEEHFMAAFTQHQRTLYGYIRSLVPLPQDADEVFSVTCMALWRKSDQFTRPAPTSSPGPAAWLNTKC